MTQALTLAERRKRWLNRHHARRAGRMRTQTAFVSAPEPRSIGHFARGRQLIAGNFLFSGVLVESTETAIWDVGQDNPIITGEIHGCGWLDDVAAVGDGKARGRAQDWVWGWIDRYDDGTGPGWIPDLTGRRLIRWINHGIFLLRSQPQEKSDQFFRSLAKQTAFLKRRWHTAAPGLPRFEALTGMIYASLSLEGMERHLQAAVTALAAECDTQIGPNGGIASRNPEALMEIVTLLIWARQTLRNADREVPKPVTDAIHRAALVLRALRLADGGLARFHGGGRGLDGRLDQALAMAGARGMPDGLAMGYARVVAGRTSMIADAAAPPMGAAGLDAHASTLAFELTSGRRPLIVNCGSGTAYGADWRRAGRATASHSTLGVEGFSSARLDKADRINDGPGEVLSELQTLDDGLRLEMAHDGWRLSHGLTHARTLDLSFDGRGLAGEDLLTTLDAQGEAQFERALDETTLQGIPFSIRFHVHPDVDARLDLGGAAVSLTLKSGEVWIFRHDGATDLSIAPSVYLEGGRLKPRPTQQVVLSGRALAYATRVSWSLAKAQDTPNSLRDLAPEQWESEGNGDE